MAKKQAVFMSVASIKNAAKTAESAHKSMERIMLSIAYQCVMTGQIGMADKLAALEWVKGFKAASNKLMKHIGVTPQMRKAGILGEAGKARFAVLRAEWADLGSDEAIYGDLLSRTEAEPKEKKELSTPEKLVRALGKVDLAGLNETQVAALQALTDALTADLNPNQVVEPAH